MAIKNKPSEPMYTFVCPMCSKIRMVRPKGFEFDPEETIDLSYGSKSMTVPKERCSFCDQKIIRKMKPSKSHTSKILKAISEQEELPEDVSLEDLL